jgi:hypothetical protein
MIKKTPQNNFTIFNWLDNLTYHKKPWSSFSIEQQNTFEPWMIHRYISMNVNYIGLANIAQKLPLTEKEKIHNIYLTLLPKNKMFLKYIKKQTKSTYADLAKYISEYYECSLGEAEEYIDIIRKEGVRSILWEMGIKEKEVDKLIKTAKIK